MKTPVPLCIVLFKAVYRDRFERGLAVSIILPEDLGYLQGKYHDLKDPSFNPFRRYLYHGGAYDFATGMDDEEMRASLEEILPSWDKERHCVVKAKAFAFVLDRAVIDVNPHDYFVGFYNWGRPLGFLQEKWKQEFFRGSEDLLFIKEAREIGAAALWPDYDHVIPNWEDLLKLGFPGLLERSEAYREALKEAETLTEDQAAFFDAVRIELQAVLRLLDRYIAFAGAHPSEKSGEIIACLKRLRLGAPVTFFDALQCMYLYFMLTEHVENYQTRSIGNGIDRTLLRFYEADLSSGRSKEELASFLGYFLMQFSAIGNYWGHPVYLGGTTKTGETKINALSYEFIRVYSELNLNNPKVQILYDDKTPVDFLNLVLSRIRQGFNSFVFCSVKGYRNAVSSYATEEEAAEFEVSGCYESRVFSDEVSAVVSYVNALKPVLFVFSDGYEETLGKQFGPKTGALSELRDFEAFLSAYLAQWDAVIERSVKIGNGLFDPSFSYVNPSILYTATIPSALKKGEDGYGGGVKYNNSSILNCGFASAVDSLMAVKKLVYDEKTVTLPELKAALDADWKGYELLRLRARALPQKYGNNEAETDALAKRLSDHFIEKVQGRPNGRGGIYKALMHSARMFIEQGKCLPATPDGRRAGEEESKNASPSVGMDKNGQTALMSSALKLCPERYSESFCLDLFLHPSSVEGDRGLSAMRAFLSVYGEGGGLAVQFNVLSAETLKDAQLHPEKYEYLQVRVCGWNVYWNQMNRTEQDAYLLRALAVRP